MKRSIFSLPIILFAMLAAMETLVVQAAPVGQQAFAVSVKDVGAKGDGVTDDTAAIESALADAAKQNGIVFFPPGEYLISRGIYLHSNLVVTGAPGAILKKIPAITQAYTQPVEAGATEVTVQDASAYQVDQDFYLWDGEGSAFTGLTGKITAIDPATNRITFEVYRSKGAAKAYGIDKTPMFSSSFSMLTTNSTKNAVENLVIEGMTFDCQRQADEPTAYNWFFAKRWG
jgi:hypothetical protein